MSSVRSLFINRKTRPLPAALTPPPYHPQPSSVATPPKAIEENPTTSFVVLQSSLCRHNQSSPRAGRRTREGGEREREEREGASGGLWKSFTARQQRHGYDRPQTRCWFESASRNRWCFSLRLAGRRTQRHSADYDAVRKPLRMPSASRVHRPACPPSSRTHARTSKHSACRDVKCWICPFVGAVRACYDKKGQRQSCCPPAAPATRQTLLSRTSKPR